MGYEVAGRCGVAHGDDLAVDYDITAQDVIDSPSGRFHCGNCGRPGQALPVRCGSEAWPRIIAAGSGVPNRVSWSTPRRSDQGVF